MKVIKDVYDHSSISYPYLNLYCKQISTNVWDLDFQKGYLEGAWDYNVFLHMGQVIISFETDYGVYRIRMLPIHYHIIYIIQKTNEGCVLINFSNINTFIKQYLDNLKYDNIFIEYVFNQLLENDILIKCEGKCPVNEEERN